MLSFVFLGEITFSLVLFGLLFGSLAMAIGGFTGKSGPSTGVASAVGIVSYLLNSMSKIFQGLKPFQPASVFHYYGGGEVLQNGKDFGDIGILLAGTVALFAVGMYGFQRRDTGR